MHIDARNLNDNTLIEGDICIIGAGAAGISIALEWINTPYKVILLEGGGLKFDEKVQQLYNGSNTGRNFPPQTASRLHYFGGTTGHWAGMCSPLDEIDFKERDWVPNSGWPITRKDLDPFYERAHETLQLGPYNYDYEYWRNEVPNLNALPLDENIIWNKMWQFSQARYGNIYLETIEQAKNIYLYTYAKVTDIKANENISNIDSVTVKNYTGETHTVKAKHFIMACGAIQNARLLLVCNKQAKNGLGNDNDVVGRYFMEHVELVSAELHMFKPYPTDLYEWKYGVTKASGELAIKENVQVKERILNGTSSLRLMSEASADNPLERINSWQKYNVNDKLDSVSTEWIEAEKAAKLGKGKVYKGFELQVRIEQSPNPNSRVTLTSDIDELGMPQANMNWELTALDKSSIRKIHFLIGQQIAIHGIGRVKLMDYFRDENDASFPDHTHGGNHHMGTTRMSNDPKKGVVNENCQVHGLSNLYVAGSGCFPTAGAPNPTLTIVALSLRLSDYVKSKISI